MSGLFHSYESLPDPDDHTRREAALEHVKEILLMLRRNFMIMFIRMDLNLIN